MITIAVNSMVHLLLQCINALTKSHCLAAVSREVKGGHVFILYFVLVDSNQDALAPLPTANCV